MTMAAWTTACVAGGLLMLWRSPVAEAAAAADVRVFVGTLGNVRAARRGVPDY